MCLQTQNLRSKPVAKCNESRPSLSQPRRFHLPYTKENLPAFSSRRLNFTSAILSEILVGLLLRQSSKMQEKIQDKRPPLKTHPRFNNYPFWKDKVSHSFHLFFTLLCSKFFVILALCDMGFLFLDDSSSS